MCIWMQLFKSQHSQKRYHESNLQPVEHKLIKTQINVPGENWISEIFSGGSDVSLMISSPVDAFNKAQLTEKTNIKSFITSKINQVKLVCFEAGITTI